MKFYHLSFGFFWLVSGVLAGILGKALVQLYNSGGSIQFSSIILGQQTEEVQRLKSEVQKLRAENDSLVRELLEGKIGKERIEKELFNAKAMAGLLPLRGPGIKIRLQDASLGNEPTELGVIESGLVHDYDILYLLNELRAAGAEAISISSGKIEERITSNTFVRCTGPTITVNNQKLTPPFTISAIGDPQVLHDSLTMRGGIVEQLRRYGLLIDITKEEEVQIAGYALPVGFAYGKFLEVANTSNDAISSKVSDSSNQAHLPKEVKNGK